MWSFITYYINVNYAPYLYEYEGNFSLLLANNNGIDGTKSTKDFDPTPLMNQSHKSIHNKTSSYRISSKIKKH